MTKVLTLVVEKWQVRPTPKWIVLKEHSVMGKLTAKRVTIIDTMYKGKVFDRTTGQEIMRRELRVGSWYKHSLKIEEINA